MNIYVHSAGFVEDYSRRRPENAPPLPAAVRSWHRELNKDDAYFALVAGRTEGGWYIEYRNLLLPDAYDIRNRRIMLNICFGALENEAQVRALALAYLDFEPIFQGSKCCGRLCPRLANAYRAQDGDYAFDFSAARHWAEDILAEFAALPPAKEEICPFICHTNPAQDSYAESIRKQLLTHRLRQRDGLRLLWAEVYTNPECGADITLQRTDATGSYTQTNKAGTYPAHRNKDSLLKYLLAVLLTVLLYYIVSRCWGWFSPPPAPQTPPQQKAAARTHTKTE